MTQANTLSARDRLRQAARPGPVVSADKPALGAVEDSFLVDGNAGREATAEKKPSGGPANLTPENSAPAATAALTALAPPVAAVAGGEKTLSGPARLAAHSRSHAEAVGKTQALRELAAMKTLTRLLEAVYARPGSSASDAERMAALSTLSINAMELGSIVARLAGEDTDRSMYIRAVSMEAVVGLVCKAWEQNREVDWGSLLHAAAAVPEVNEAAEAMAKAFYRPVNTPADAHDRMATSMHAAFWQVYGLGDAIDGMSPKLAAEIIRECAGYLNSRDRFVADNDLQVSWMQGSIRRMTDLVCAEFRARFAGKNVCPTQDDVESVLAVARSGFEGVENYAQSILEKPSSSPVPRPDAA